MCVVRIVEEKKNRTDEILRSLFIAGGCNFCLTLGMFIVVYVFVFVVVFREGLYYIKLI